jgi:phosphatidylinositol alpha 1,6-mannosyltransferase
MRIAFVTETFLPRVNGITHTLTHLLGHLSQRGHTSLMIAPAGAPARFADTPIVPVRGMHFPWYPEWQAIPPSPMVAQTLRAFEPDLVHVVNPISLGLSGLRAGRALRRPVVASYHTDVPGFLSRWNYRWLAGPVRAWLRWLHNQADVNWCPSETTRAELSRQGFERMQVWSRGVDTARFSPAHRDPAWRARLSDGHPDALLLLYVGRVSHEKRVAWLLDALRAARQVNPAARLVIAGDGPARAQLHAQAAGLPVHFAGYLHGHDLACAYAACDMFVFPSANETFGNVALEAMASGLPVIAARAGGILDFVHHGTEGLLFNSDDAAQFAQHATTLAADAAMRTQLAAAGRAVALGRSWSGVLDRLLDDYAAIVASR